MEYKTFINTLSRSCGMETKRTGAFAEALKDVIVHSLTEMNDVAIPGFGTFCAAKTDEYITVDTDTGQRILMPPSVKAKLRVVPGLKRLYLNQLRTKVWHR